METRRSAQSLDVVVCCHQGRYGVEIMIESLLRDRTVSWVRIVNGINKYVTEMSEEIPVVSVENGCTGKLAVKVKPRPKPTSTLTPVSVPYRERKWTDIDPGKFSQGCFEVSKLMIRLSRHDGTVRREDDGVVRFDDLAEKFTAKFDDRHSATNSSCRFLKGRDPPQPQPIHHFFWDLRFGQGLRRPAETVQHPGRFQHGTEVFRGGAALLLKDRRSWNNFLSIKQNCFSQGLRVLRNGQLKLG